MSAVDEQVRRTGMIAAADDELTIFERSKPGRRAFVAPELDVPERSGVSSCTAFSLAAARQPIGRRETNRPIPYLVNPLVVSS